MSILTPRLDLIDANITRSTVTLTNSAVTSILSVAAFNAGELVGYVSLTATASTRFLIKIQYSKTAAGTDYNLSYQSSGETPVAGFAVSVTTAGLIQITLPIVTGFSTATFTYVSSGLI